jgi:hypothetical protein
MLAAVIAGILRFMIITACKERGIGTSLARADVP